MRPAPIVCARSSLSRSANVRSDVGMTPRLPRGEPGMSVRFPAAGVPDEVRNPQRNAEHERDYDSRRPEIHGSAPFSHDLSGAGEGPRADLVLGASAV